MFYLRKYIISPALFILRCPVLHPVPPKQEGVAAGGGREQHDGGGQKQKCIVYHGSENMKIIRKVFKI